MIANVPDSIPRERVRSRIAQASRFPLTLIIAPAGCGKTTALEQYLTAVAGPVACYRVQPGEGTLAQFILGLAQSFGGRTFPLDVAQEMVGSYSDRRLDTSIASMAEECARRLRDTGNILAIDDLHHAQSREIVRFIDELVARTRGGARWIIATRARELLPLGEWLAKGICGPPIDERTLLFTDEDVAEAARARNMLLSNEQTSAISSATFGLPIGVGLALRYADAGYDMTEIAAQTRFASYEYLTSHMYSQLDQSEQSCLCFGALLPTLRVDIFEAAGFAGASKMLYDIYQRSSFLSRRSAAGSAAADEYVCHDLFRDYLRHQLRARGRDEEQSLQRRAARALTATGMVAAALPLYASSESFAELAESLARDGYMLIDEGRGDLVEAAINALPSDDARWRSTALQLRAELAARTKNYKVVEGLFVAALECASNEEERIRTLFRFAQHQHVHDSEGAERTLEEILSSRESPADIRAHAFAYLLATRAWKDPYYDLREQLAAFESTVNLIANDRDRIDALLFACCGATFCGDPRAERLGQAAIELALSASMFRALPALYGTLARNALYRGDDPHVVLRYAEQEEAMIPQVDERAGRANVLLKLGVAMRSADTSEVRSLLRQYDAYKLPSNDAAESVVARARAFLSAWDGAFDEAYDLLINAWHNSYGLYRPVVKALCAIFAAAAGRREDLRRLLQEGATWLHSIKPWNEALVRNTEITRQLYAFAAAVAGRHRDALHLLRQRSPGSGPFVRALSDIVRALIGGSGIVLAEEDVVCEQLSGLGYGDVAMIVRAVLKKYHSLDDAGASLTPQQREVLEALAAGLAPKQIAEMMDRRLSTIHGHIRNAVAKLGCSGREQAIRIARSRGLLKR